MMASIPNMRSTPLTLPATKAPPAGEAVPGDFAAQLPAVPGQPLEAVILPDARIDPIAPLLPAPKELKAGQSGDGENAGEAAEAKTGESKDDGPQTPAIPIPSLQPALPVAQPATDVPAAVVAGAKVPAEAAPAPARVSTPVGKTRGKPCGRDGDKAGLPVPDGAEAATETVENGEIEAAVKQLLQRRQGQARQVAAAPGIPAGDAAKPEVAPDLALPHGRTRAQPRGEAPVASAASKAAVPLPVAELPQTAPIAGQTQPEPATTEKPATVEGTRTTELAVERKLDLARDSRWLDRLARDIAQAGSSDTPLRFRLHPQTLGHLQVELQQGDRGTAVRLTVETEAARQILADAQPRLAAEARAQGVRIAETHVEMSSSGRQAPGDQRRQDEARQTPLIRTPRGAGDAAAAARPPARARLDRYA